MFRQQNPVLCVSVDILYLLYYLTKTLLTLHPYFYLLDYAEFRQPDPEKKILSLSIHPRLCHRSPNAELREADETKRQKSMRA